MDRLETAKLYMSKLAELRSFDLKRMNPQHEGLPFVTAYLYKNKGKAVYPGDIAKEAGVSTARIAAALNKLEESNLISRIPSEADSRKTVVSLTEEGVRAAENRFEKILNFTADIIDMVGTEDMDEFLRITQKMKNAIQELETRGKSNV